MKHLKCDLIKLSDMPNKLQGPFVFHEIAVQVSLAWFYNALHIQLGIEILRISLAHGFAPKHLGPLTSSASMSPSGTSLLSSEKLCPLNCSHISSSLSVFIVTRGCRLFMDHRKYDRQCRVTEQPSVQVINLLPDLMDFLAWCFHFLLNVVLNLSLSCPFSPRIALSLIPDFNEDYKY